MTGAVLDAAVVLKHSVVAVRRRRLIKSSAPASFVAFINPHPMYQDARSSVIKTACKGVDVLQNNTREHDEERCFLILAQHVIAICGNFAVFNVIEAVEQGVSNNCLPAPVITKATFLMTRLCIKRNIMQHSVARLVPKSASKANVSLRERVPVTVRHCVVTLAQPVRYSAFTELYRQ